MELHFFVAHWEPPGADAPGGAQRAAQQSSSMKGVSVKLSTGSMLAQHAPPSAQAIAPFCYPLGSAEYDLAPAESARMKYTFSLLDKDGKPLHGFCRRHTLQQSTDGKLTELPIVLCLLAPAPYFHVCFRCLEILHHLLSAEALLPNNAKPVAAAPTGHPSDSAASSSSAEEVHSTAGTPGSEEQGGADDGNSGRRAEAEASAAGNSASERQEISSAPGEQNSSSSPAAATTSPASAADMAETLPIESSAATFMTALHVVFADTPAPGQVLRLTLPRRNDYALAPLPTIQTDLPTGGGGTAQQPRRLEYGTDFAEVQVPPHLSPPGAPAEAVVPFACLVVNLEPAVLATLVASLLMERRIVLLAHSFATLATAAHAAAALLRPFRWHHVFLPLLPATLVDVLASPTPYIVGLPQALADRVAWGELDSVVVVDLDGGTITPTVDDAASDSQLLPGWRQLVAALAALKENLRSPHEYRANGTIAAMLQEYLAATIGGYRGFIKSPAQQTPAPRGATASARISSGVKSLRARLNESRNSDAPEDAGDGMSRQSSARPAFMDECIISGTGGYRFYHSAFVESFSGRARTFAAALIHTQLWQVFITERMAMMQQPYAADDDFETRVLARQARDRTVGGQLSTMGQRVRESQRGAALARWTSERARAIGKSAATAIDKAMSRLEGSPSASPREAAYTNSRPPQEFFDELDPTARQSSAALRSDSSAGVDPDACAKPRAGGQWTSQPAQKQRSGPPADWPRDAAAAALAPPAVAAYAQAQAQARGPAAAQEAGSDRADVKEALRAGLGLLRHEKFDDADETLKEPPAEPLSETATAMLHSSKKRLSAALQSGELHAEAGAPDAGGAAAPQGRATAWGSRTLRAAQDLWQGKDFSEDAGAQAEAPAQRYAREAREHAQAASDLAHGREFTEDAGVEVEAPAQRYTREAKVHAQAASDLAHGREFTEDAGIDVEAPAQRYAREAKVHAQAVDDLAHGREFAEDGGAEVEAPAQRYAREAAPMLRAGDDLVHRKQFSEDADAAELAEAPAQRYAREAAPTLRAGDDLVHGRAFSEDAAVVDDAARGSGGEEHDYADPAQFSLGSEGDAESSALELREGVEGGRADGP